MRRRCSKNLANVTETCSEGNSDGAVPLLLSCPPLPTLGEVFDYLVAHGRMKEKEARAKFRQVSHQGVAAGFFFLSFFAPVIARGRPLSPHAPRSAVLADCRGVTERRGSPARLAGAALTPSGASEKPADTRQRIIE